MNRIVALVQARMGSTRLPGKVLSDLAGQPLLVRLIERLRRSRAIHEIVIATSKRPGDDPIAELAKNFGLPAFRGSEDDVLSRFAAAARAFRADLIVRITGDCPLIDPEVVDRVVRELTESRADYASNVLERRFPRGLDVEALWGDTLWRIDRLARSATAREHVTTFARWEHPELFVMRSVLDNEDHSDLRWTVDTRDDLEYVRLLYDEVCLADHYIGYRELIARIRAEPTLLRFDTRSRAAE